MQLDHPFKPCENCQKLPKITNDVWASTQYACGEYLIYGFCDVGDESSFISFCKPLDNDFIAYVYEAGSVSKCGYFNPDSIVGKGAALFRQMYLDTSPYNITMVLVCI